MWQFTYMACLYALASIVTAWVAVRSWRLRHTRAAIYLAISSGAGSLWSASYLAGFFNTSLPWKLVMLRFEYLGIVTTVFFFLLFAISYSRLDNWLSLRRIILLACIPVISYFLILTLNWHDFFYRQLTLGSAEGLVVLDKVYGPGYYILSTYCYILILCALFCLLGTAFRRSTALRRQMEALLISTILVLVPNFLYLSGFNPFSPYDATSLSFALVGLILLRSITSHHLLELLPIAHEQVFEHARIGAMVLDDRGRILDMNPAAADLMVLNSDLAVGKDIALYLPHVAEDINRQPWYVTELVLDSGRMVELQSAPLSIHRGTDNEGRVIMLYDLTHRKQAEDELRLQATTDPLTGLFNRRHFFLLANRLLQQAYASPQRLSVAMIDIDRFKQINDRYSHATGDTVLQGAAKTFARHVREADVLCRFGGEEFSLVMPDTDVTEASGVVERLAQALREQTFVRHLDEPISLTFSAGIAMVDIYEEKALDRALSAADKALYKAKELGRDRIEIARPGN